MKKTVQFEYPIRGNGRPQIVLIGNGLERKSGQVAWDQLVDHLTVSNCIALTEEEKRAIPFPLMYEVLVLGRPIPQVLDQDVIKNIENRLKKEMKSLVSLSNDLLDELPSLHADHIFTTNYSYCLERAFFAKRDFSASGSRSSVRFNLLPLDENGKQKRESQYRLHSGYLARNNNSTNVGLWHIHGESSSSEGIVLGHDRYGRLLKRIIEVCTDVDYKSISKDKPHCFTSWPELFLFGDVYVIGFGFELSEFDLWWLLKRKQRERYGDGKVFFYDRNITLKESLPLDSLQADGNLEKTMENDDIMWHNHSVRKKNLRDKLLSAHGVQILDCGSSNATSYDEFYKMAFADVRMRIEKHRA
ncbi:MAG: SIR2 family protein [Lachnospiraceae bacterium]|nr:SIR2 family protein [Lachnospiraceae bacterium]